MKRNSKDTDRNIEEEYKRYLERIKKRSQKAGMEEFKRIHIAEIVEAANQYEL